MEEIIPASVAADYTRAQLHGEACIVCGSSMDGLTPVGHVRTPGLEPGTAPLGWAVRACPQHVGAGEALCGRSQAGGVA